MSVNSWTTPQDLDAVREQFPLLRRKVRGKPLIYLDSAATSLRPRCVIDAVAEAMTDFAGNIGRSVHLLAEEVSARFAEHREVVANFINADPDTIVFTSGATQALNLVAANTPAEQAVFVTTAEHHSNLLPWFQRERLEFVNTSPQQGIDLNHLESLLRRANGGLVAISHVTNSFGALNPVAEIAEIAHRHGAQVLVDASQSISHLAVNVAALDCDYLCFSGHKMCGPTGVGVLFAKHERLSKMQPTQLGGGMVSDVQPGSYTLARTPQRFEAGTPPLEAVAGLNAACEFLEGIGLERLGRHGQELTQFAKHQLSDLRGVRVRGPGPDDPSGPIVAFDVEGLESHGVARILANRFNICVRSGFHCAQLAHTDAGLPSTIRASFHMYTNQSEICQLVEGIRAILQVTD